MLTRWLAVAALTALCTLPLGVAAQPNNTPARATTVVAEPHPQIIAAIRALERAKQHLQHAAHDFGGHRVEAIQAIDGALVQLKLALEYDKK
jgi:predicted outer membrane protein